MTFKHNFGHINGNLIMNILNRHCHIKLVGESAQSSSLGAASAY